MDEEWVAFLVLTGFLVVGIALQLAYFIPQFRRQERELEKYRQLRKEREANNEDD